MPTDFYARHADLLQQAVEHAAGRGYWTPHPETPSTSVYGAEAPQQGEAAFRVLLGNPFLVSRPNIRLAYGTAKKSHRINACQEVDSMPHKRPDGPDYFARHRPLLEPSVAAPASRDHWTPCPESPSKSVYGEDAAKNGEAAFRDRLGGHFGLPGHQPVRRLQRLPRQCRQSGGRCHPVRPRLRHRPLSDAAVAPARSHRGVRPCLTTSS